MPRTARRLSETNMYHVMLRGNEQKQIFQDEEDNIKFIKILNDIKEESKFQIYAYCLMGNHVHILIRTCPKGEPLNRIFRRIGAKYVFWYNGKHMRIGHLFQDRYKSEPIEDEAYMLAVMRYIHRNPLKAGITDDIAGYPYSSYNDYLQAKEGCLTDTEFISGFMGCERYKAFHLEWDDHEYLDIKPIRPRISDEYVKKLIEGMTQCETIEAFQALSDESRKEALKALKARGISYRQLSRLTGESTWTIQNL